MKMTVDFNNQASRLIKRISKHEHRSSCEILRRAIGLYKYLHEEMHGHELDRTIAILDGNGNVVKKLKWI
jgi:hypothetical protein